MLGGPENFDKMKIRIPNLFIRCYRKFGHIAIYKDNQIDA